jgi:hypothetical protein
MKPPCQVLTTSIGHHRDGHAAESQPILVGDNERVAGERVTLRSEKTKSTEPVQDALIGVPLGDSPRFGVRDYLEVGDKGWPDVIGGREFLGDFLEAFPHQTVLDVLATDIDQGFPARLTRILVAWRLPAG